MDFVQILLLLGMFAGFVCVFVSFFGGKKEEDAEEAPFDEAIGKRLEVIDESISEADSVISELDGISRTALKEMDQKYQELLFLYNLIDEKKKEIAYMPEPAVHSAERDMPGPQVFEMRAPDIKKPETLPAERNKPTNPRASQIFAMRQDGMTVAQIAKELNMGQGEVSLIMTLNSPT